MLRSKVNIGTIVLVDVEPAQGLTSLDFFTFPVPVSARDFQVHLQQWKEKDGETRYRPLGTLPPRAVPLRIKRPRVLKSGSHNLRGGVRAYIYATEASGCANTGPASGTEINLEEPSPPAYSPWLHPFFPREYLGRPCWPGR